MARVILIVFGFQFLLKSLAFGQEPPRAEIDLEEFIERLFPIQDEDIDYEGIYEALFQLYQNPIDINQATAEILQATYLLTPAQLSNFLSYRKSNGPLLSLYELQAIPGFDLPLIQTLIPFLTIGSAINHSKPFFDRIEDASQAYLLVRHRRIWETRRGFTPPDTSSTGRISSRYLGDANELYVRFRLQKSRDFSFGFTLDKDAGEQFIWDRRTRRYGFNFVSFHFARYQVGKWRSIQIGDYQVAFGQGLVFGAGYTLGKGAETVPTVRRSSAGLLPYTAALEFGFFRGVGGTYNFSPSLSATLITSHVSRDGRIQNELDSLDQRESFSSINQSGLHRTPSEIETKNTLKETSLGFNVQYAKNDLSLGINGLYTRFDRPWQRTPRPDNQFDFAGNQNTVSSVYFNYNLKNTFLFGETAISSSGGHGSVLGFISSLSRQVSFSLLWRKYDPSFHSFYSNAFAESTRPTNESGVYLGLELRPIKKWRWNFYYDFFKFPWLRFRAYAPSSGYEWLSRLTFQPNRSLTVFAQIRQEQKDRNLPDDGQRQLTYQLAALNKVNGIFSVEYQATKNLYLRSRVLFSRINFNQEKSNGLMVFQDVRFQQSNWRLTGRIAIFETDNYDNRLYAFENNVLWAFSLPAFSGQGMRYYLLGQLNPTARITLYLRFARTIFTDREEISSGLRTIDGNTQTETSFLLRYNLFK
ncbi:ComEA family DNA-binding protein [Algoriphagus namhaensis]|uniref:ComEA family DNA-binding protein n=1 Tax=Algoriphagus namhaensis TaxID=915353 RepID=A0ABV8AUT4_9BACT